MKLGWRISWKYVLGSVLLFGQQALSWFSPAGAQAQGPGGLSGHQGGAVNVAPNTQVTPNTQQVTQQSGGQGTGVGSGTGGVDNPGLRDVFITIFNLLNFIIPVLVILGVVLFIISVLRYIFSSSDEDKATARKNMIWGIIGLFVMVSIWGLVNVLANTFDLNNTMPDIPCIKDPNTNQCI